MSADFHPYNPRRFRLGVLAAAVACVALGAWALATARETGAIEAWARAGLALGLLGAFAYILWHLRPREGWGVKLEPMGVTVSRPMSGQPIELVWSQISEVRRGGKKRDTLVILVRPEGRVLVPGHLFKNTPAFEALAEALERRAPPMPHDA